MTHFIAATTSTASSYSSAFPPLQAFPWAFHKQPSFHHASPTSSAPSTPSSSHHSLHLFTALAPPKYPAYLKHTTYASLATDQYQHLQQKKKQSDSEDYNKDLVEIDLRLPQYWNINDKSRHLQIGLNGYALAYHAHIPGPGKKELTEAASIRTNFPMRPQCGVYYYEITIVSMGNDGLFAVGLCNASHPLDKLPGASLGSFGYHGQSGQTYCQNTKGVAYGPTYGHGDVIGCGVNYFDGTVFFTRNGISLGCAFNSIDLSSQAFYPCIGLSTQGEKITANFGQAEFAFDIVQYIKDQQRTTIHQVCHVPVEAFPQDRYKIDTKSQIDAMVLSYLAHQGYIGTVNAMKKNIDYVSNTQADTPASNDSLLDQDTRSSIRQSIMTGHVDLAIQKTETMYPNLLEDNADLLFQLKTRKFLDILMDDHHGEPPSSVQSLCSTSDPNNSSDTDDDTVSVQSGRSRAQSINSSDIQHQILYEEQPVTFGHHTAPPLVSPPLPVAASGRRLSWAAIAASPSTDSHLEEYPLQSNGSARRRRLSSVSSHHGRRSSYCSNISLNEDDETSKTMTTVRKAMHYGQQLQDEYQHTKYWSQLTDLFTLLSFSDPKSSPMSHLLDTSPRDLIASDLNDAIQAYQHQANKSNLEWVLKQAIVTSKELALSGHGKASLLHMQNQFTSK
ncbi:ran-binding protein 9 [Mucor ambiguus]|uniref:Ran-binding protein 9 n=1 Tax=Mucor ambiguus TaxID=91626 RepID=A0A0C9MEU6_9FUNG|nr:ran-binding protein 9 [Mucor ambiguus]